MSFFDQAYDEMSWEEVCYRLPSDLAVNALIRRVTNLDTMKMFFESVGTQPSSIKPLKDHVNSLLSAETPDDILDNFGDETFEKILFTWANDENVKRIKNNDPTKLSLKFLFNSTESDDRSGMLNLLDKVLQEQYVNISHLQSVMTKADSSIFCDMINPILKDNRPEVKASLLSVGGLSNSSMLGEHQKIIALKAFAKCDGPKPLSGICRLSLNAFRQLRPDERLDALEKYLNYFPEYMKVKVFDPHPDRDEVDTILFAGCIEKNEKVKNISEKYDRITEASPPKDDEEENDV